MLKIYISVKSKTIVIFTRDIYSRSSWADITILGDGDEKAGSALVLWDTEISAQVVGCSLFVVLSPPNLFLPQGVTIGCFVGLFP